jgi:hypothetical protein
LTIAKNIFLVKMADYIKVYQYQTRGVPGRRIAKIRLTIGEIIKLIGETPKKGNKRKITMIKPYCSKISSHFLAKSKGKRPIKTFPPSKG